LDHKARHRRALFFAPNAPTVMTGGTSMILRVGAAALMVFAATSSATAQREPPRRFPAEKFSPKPVQSPVQAPSSSAIAATVYSPWIKYCGTDNGNQPAEPVCLTVKEARLETGQFIAGAALVDNTAREQKHLRISLPLGIRLMPGARVFIDGEAMRTVPPLQCIASVCITGFEVTADFIAKLKRGDRLKLEGIDIPEKLEGLSISGWIATWPLADFARAFDGPPTDPKTFEVEQEELQNRIERERKRSN